MARRTRLKTTSPRRTNAGVKVYTDFIPNHDGFRNGNNAAFVAEGGYPGFVLSTASERYGDFHDPSLSYTTDGINGSLFGLIDIAQEENIPLIRQPVAAGNPDNIPAGTLWNKPDPNNARFYAGPGLGRRAVQRSDVRRRSFTRYHCTFCNPLAGDPVKRMPPGC